MLGKITPNSQVQIERGGGSVLGNLDSLAKLSQIQTVQTWIKIFHEQLGLHFYISRLENRFSAIG